MTGSFLRLSAECRRWSPYSWQAAAGAAKFYRVGSNYHTCGYAAELTLVRLTATIKTEHRRRDELRAATHP